MRCVGGCVQTPRVLSCYRWQEPVFCAKSNLAFHCGATARATCSSLWSVWKGAPHLATTQTALQETFIHLIHLIYQLGDIRGVWLCCSVLQFPNFSATTHDFLQSETLTPNPDCFYLNLQRQTQTAEAFGRGEGIRNHWFHCLAAGGGRAQKALKERLLWVKADYKSTVLINSRK